MKLTVIGTGYVGLVAGGCFAEMGHQVTCVDKVPQKIQLLKDGKIPIYEPGLEDIVKRNYKEGRLNFSLSVTESVKDVSIVFLAVGTPSAEDGRADLADLFNVVKELAPHIHKDTIIATKSTVPVGTGSKIRTILKENNAKSIEVVSNPEFLKEGHAVEDFMRPDRIIIGCGSLKAKSIFEEVYAPFSRTTNRIIFMSVESAEMTKYAANAMLATRISFMNELAKVCEATHADINDVRLGIGSDKRIGSLFLFPGTGFGGSCFPKDIRSLLHIAKDCNSEVKIMDSVYRVNEEQKKVLYYKALQYFRGDLQKKKFALWGLSFKPNTDDIREAPALSLIDALLQHECDLHVYDPVAMENVKKIYRDKLHYHANSYDTLQSCDALFIVTEWNEFRRLNYDEAKNRLKNHVIFDGRNLFEPDQMKEHRITYWSIGRHAVTI